jgi:hypothetical protein
MRGGLGVGVVYLGGRGGGAPVVASKGHAVAAAEAVHGCALYNTRAALPVGYATV